MSTVSSDRVTMNVALFIHLSNLLTQKAAFNKWWRYKWQYATKKPLQFQFEKQNKKHYIVYFSLLHPRRGTWQLCWLTAVTRLCPSMCGKAKGNTDFLTLWLLLKRSKCKVTARRARPEQIEREAEFIQKVASSHKWTLDIYPLLSE